MWETIHKTKLVTYWRFYIGDLVGVVVKDIWIVFTFKDLRGGLNLGLEDPHPKSLTMKNCLEGL